MTIPSEDSPKFRERMRQAMEVSCHKYGPIRDAFPHKVDAIGSLEDRLRLYKETGNADYLVDIANFAMMRIHCTFSCRPRLISGAEPEIGSLLDSRPTPGPPGVRG